MDHSRSAIFDYADEVAGRIAKNLRETWYNDHGVSFDYGWSTQAGDQAWASVAPDLEAPTRHSVVMTYDLVESIHGLACEFARFAFGGGQGHPAGFHLVPDQFGMERAAEILFASGIAFVMFHEVGHINQGHGSIRRRYGPANASYLNLHEFDVRTGVADPPAQGLYAAILHATELAADFEALDWMAATLLVEFRGTDLVDHAYLQCAIVSSIMLLFNGGNPMRMDAEPVGTHPYPTVRMDLWVKAYTERMRIFADEVGAAFDALKVLKVLSDARLLSTMSWLWRTQVQNEPAFTDIVKGFLAHPNVSEYMRRVIDAWSLVYREARGNRKFGMPLSVLYYTDEYRASVGACPNEETLLEHVRQSLIATLSQEEQERELDEWLKKRRQDRNGSP